MGVQLALIPAYRRVWQWLTLGLVTTLILVPTMRSEEGAHGACLPTAIPADLSEISGGGTVA